MLLKYIQAAPNQNKGDVVEVDDLQANVLIKLGLAEEVVSKSEKAKTKANKLDTK